MKFSVRVRGADGKTETRIVEAASRFAVYSQVEKEGNTVESVVEGGGVSLPSWMKLSIGGGRIKIEERITFTKNLSAMLTAGLTLSRALSVIERQSTNKKLKEVTAGLSEAVKEAFAFIASHQLRMWKGISDTVFAT